MRFVGSSRTLHGCDRGISKQPFFMHECIHWNVYISTILGPLVQADLVLEKEISNFLVSLSHKIGEKALS